MDTRFHGYDKGKKKWIPAFAGMTMAERNGYPFSRVGQRQKDMDTRFHGYDKDRKKWIPAFMGMTKYGHSECNEESKIMECKGIEILHFVQDDGTYYPFSRV